MKYLPPFVSKNPNLVTFFHENERVVYVDKDLE
jgi:hypothetical protein